MSLTRAQWLEMWNDIRIIQKVLNLSHVELKERKQAQLAINEIKHKIQMVVGQLE
jgi:hypothetical protein